MSLSEDCEWPVNILSAAFTTRSADPAAQPPLVEQRTRSILSKGPNYNKTF